MSVETDVELDLQEDEEFDALPTFEHGIICSNLNRDLTCLKKSTKR